MSPKIVSVTPQEEFVLIVDFDNNVTKKIDMLNKLNETRFCMLKNKVFFKSFKNDYDQYINHHQLKCSEYEDETYGFVPQYAKVEKNQV